MSDTGPPPVGSLRGSLVGWVRNGGSHRHGVIVLVAGILVLALIVPAALMLAGGGGGGGSSTEILAEPVAFVGLDPFTPSIVPDVSDISPRDDGALAGVIALLHPDVGHGANMEFAQLDLPELEPGVITTVDGSAPGLYGGTNLVEVCDKPRLLAFLQHHADRAGAWAEVQGIPVAGLTEYIDRLTDAILQVDARVVNHGFRAGEAYQIDSILQAGSAVLVDQFGVPRVRCYCGNPLLPAVALSGEVTVTGRIWPGFSLEGAVSVVGVTEVEEFTMQDVVEGRHFIKPARRSPVGTTTTSVPSATTTITPSTTAPPMKTNTTSSSTTSSTTTTLTPLPDAIDLTYEDNGTAVLLDPGIRLSVSLPGSPGVGQVWELRPFDGAVLSQVGEREFVADDPSSIGGGGHFVFRFEGRSAGTTAVEMILYFRGVESTDPGSRFSVTVTVR